MDLSGPRWKGRGFAEIANSNPMSRVVLQLQTALSQSGTAAFLAGNNALLRAEPEIANLLSRAAFGREVINSGTDNQIFQLGPEEAFYLSHSLKCLKITRDSDDTPPSENELWAYLKSKNEAFPESYMAYKHLRSKNWVVKPGIQYGVDFVAYRHHPALVHSEYAVIVVREGDRNSRLSSMTDLYCTLRACGSVAKTLLKLSIRCCGVNGSMRDSPDCLEDFDVDERTITRFIPAQSREDRDLDEVAMEFGEKV
ncbi:probable tRNA-splicing endonuclease subunit Sen2 [Ananas comosus]|uniref:tRNA-intron lyase n=1 Tax=Ananas comosus TaxID=4615 RepID=A0A6P5G3T6_ANACO|nr:probable tRNA-splicing endonuclease subunit Sen2 [Ananas comosus]